jgi:hypothetical protein
MSLLCSGPVRSFCFRVVATALLTSAAVGCGGQGNVSGKVSMKVARKSKRFGHFLGFLAVATFSSELSTSA